MMNSQRCTPGPNPYLRIPWGGHEELQEFSRQGGKGAKEVMEAWDMDCDGRLNISEFTRCVSDVSVFRDFDRDGDNSLSQAEFSAALVHLDIDTNPIDAFTKYADDDAGEGGTPAVTLSGFGRATNDLLTKNLSASFRHRRPLPLPPASEEKPRNRLRSSSGDFI